MRGVASGWQVMRGGRGARWLAVAWALGVASCRTGGGPGAPGVPAAAAALGPPYDLVIEGGRVVDGTGNAWFYGDVAIRGDRIARVAPPGMLHRARARDRLDARGLVVAPGFIDIQSQSREALLTADGRVVSKATQGITTEILGEGETNAPVNERVVAAGGPAAGGFARRFTGPHGFAAWLTALEQHGISVNVGAFVGGGTVRAYAAGLRMGPATPEEIDTMRAVVRRAMEDGAFGLATALIYMPGSFSSTEELIAVARAMAPYGGLYITHLRSEADQLLEALAEAMRIGREGGVPVEIYHLKAAGQRNWAKAGLAVAMIDSARAAGLDVQANMYPYVAAGTGLAACLPPWASAEGRLFANLADREARARIRADALRERVDWENLCALAGPEGVLILGVAHPDTRRWAGKRVAEIAAAQGKPWVDVVLDLLLAEGRDIGAIYYLMSEDNVALQLRQPWMKFGTDAGGVDPDSARGLVHPRAYGTYPRILGQYVREERVLALEEAVRRATSAVATRLSIRDRGLLREGYYADIVVFDPATVADRATFERPHRLSLGVRDVFVNGVGVVRRGRHTGAKPGRVVRGPGYVVRR